MVGNLLFISAALFLSLDFVRFGGLPIADWLFFLGLLAMAVETVLSDKRNLACWTRNRLLPFAVLILIGSTASMVYSIDLKAAVVETVQIMYVFTLFTSMAWIAVRRGITDKVIQAFILSGVFAASVAIYDRITGGHLGPMLSGVSIAVQAPRYVGPLRFFNKLGYFLVLTSLLTIYRWLVANRTYQKLLQVLALGAQMWGIYLSGSLTAYLGLLLGVGVIVFASKPVLGRLKTVIVLAAVLLGVLVTSFFILQLNLSRSFGAASNISGAISRVETITAFARLQGYHGAWDQIVENPLIGVGNDQISASSASKRILSLAVHNILLESWYTGGFFSFLGIFGLLVYLFFTAARTVLRHRGETSSHSWQVIVLSAVVISIIFMDQFQPDIYQREKWVILGLFLGNSWPISTVPLKGNDDNTESGLRH